MCPMSCLIQCTKDILARFSLGNQETKAAKDSRAGVHLDIPLLLKYRGPIKELNVIQDTKIYQVISEIIFTIFYTLLSVFSHWHIV